MKHAERILPPSAHFTTEGGLTVEVARRGRVPLVSIRLVVQSGAATDPPDRVGLADFTVRLMRRGTARLDADALNEAVEFVGGTLAVFAAEDFVALAVTTPAEHLPGMLDVLAQMVREPTFPQHEFDTERDRTLAQFANDLDDPGLLADRALQRALWERTPTAMTSQESALRCSGWSAATSSPSTMTASGRWCRGWFSSAPPTSRRHARWWSAPSPAGREGRPSRPFRPR